MADLSVTAANVVPQAGATFEKSYVFGETVTAGMPVYLSAAKWYMCKNSDTAAMAAMTGIAVCGGSLNQPAVVQIAGTVSFGTASLTLGETYCVSNDFGKICPIADIGSSEYVTHVMVAITTAIAQLICVAYGVEHA